MRIRAPVGVSGGNFVLAEAQTVGLALLARFHDRRCNHEVSAGWAGHAHVSHRVLFTIETRTHEDINYLVLRKEVSPIDL